MAPFTDDTMLTFEDSALWQYTLGFVRIFVKVKMNGEPTENLWPRHYHKILGAVWLGKRLVCLRNYL